MSVGNSGVKGGRRRRSRRNAPMSEINVTPFVDVMLVLLIIFMVAAPLLTVGHPVNSPETQAQTLNSQTQPITISVTKEGEIYINKTQIDESGLIEKLQAIAKAGYDERIFVQGDTDASYGTVVRVMGQISAAGYKKIDLVTKQIKRN